MDGTYSCQNLCGNQTFDISDEALDEMLSCIHSALEINAMNLEKIAIAENHNNHGENPIVNKSVVTIQNTPHETAFDNSSNMSASQNGALHLDHSLGGSKSSLGDNNILRTGSLTSISTCEDIIFDNAPNLMTNNTTDTLRWLFDMPDPIGNGSGCVQDRHELLLKDAQTAHPKYQPCATKKSWTTSKQKGSLCGKSRGIQKKELPRLHIPTNNNYEPSKLLKPTGTRVNSQPAANLGCIGPPNPQLEFYNDQCLKTQLQTDGQKYQRFLNNSLVNTPVRHASTTPEFKPEPTLWEVEVPDPCYQMSAADILIFFEDETLNPILDNLTSAREKGLQQNTGDLLDKYVSKIMKSSPKSHYRDIRAISNRHQLTQEKGRSLNRGASMIRSTIYRWREDEAFIPTNTQICVSRECVEAAQVSKGVQQSLEAEFRFEDAFLRGTSHVQSAPPSRRRRKAQEYELKWEPMLVYHAAYTNINVSHLGKSTYSMFLPKLSCFGKINMRMKRAWTRKPNRLPYQSPTSNVSEWSQFKGIFPINL